MEGAEGAAAELVRFRNISQGGLFCTLKPRNAGTAGPSCLCGHIVCSRGVVYNSGRSPPSRSYRDVNVADVAVLLEQAFLDANFLQAGLRQQQVQESFVEEV